MLLLLITITQHQEVVIMTKAYSTAKATKTKPQSKTLRAASQRHYTVGYISVRHQPKADTTKTHYSKHPALHLKGNWLQEAGFTTGQSVTITAEKGRLIVEVEK